MAWTTTGANIKGPQGDPGATGPKGDPGDDGAGIAIAGSVATYAELPTTLTAGDAGSGYLVTTDGLLYIWDGTQFPVDGSGVAFRGPKGDTGDTGPQGAPGATGATGSPGSPGAAATLAVGTTTTGAVGSNASVTNSGSSAAAVFEFTVPRGATGATGDPGNDGAPGATGTRGTQWFFGALLSDAPSTGTQVGDVFLETSSGIVYQMN